MNDEGTDCPIESNIHSTAGKWGDDDCEMNDDDNQDSPNNGFSDEFDSNGDDGWSSATPISQGDIHMPQPPSPKAEIGPDGQNLGGEGAAINKGARPEIKGDLKHKCWICHVCNAINNLLETFQKFEMRCCICKYAFKPEAPIIFSHDWDGPKNEDETVYTVWDCPFCTLKNDMAWIKCDTCGNEKPPPDQVQLSYIYKKPKMFVDPNAKKGAAGYAPNADKGKYQVQKDYQYNDFNVAKARVGGAGARKNFDNNWGVGNNVQRKIIKPRIANIGVARAVDKYPTDSFENKCEDRLTNVFGSPYRNKHVLKLDHHAWALQITVGHSRLEWSTYSNDAVNFISTECVGRGIAINERTGWMACMSCNELWVFEPTGASGFKLVVKHMFSNEQKLSGEDMQNSRIRFVGDGIYIWSFRKARVYVFKLFSHRSLSLIDVIKDRYFKDSQTMDVLVTDDLLILLFDRWCGVYKLYPKFEWYHAVAFATKPVNCFSFEMVTYDDFKDRTPKHQEKFFENDSDCKDFGGGGDSKENEEKNGGTFGISNLKSKLRSKRKKNASEFFENEKKSNTNSKMERDTYSNYLFINCESQIVGIHPSNPTFDFLRIASNCQHAKCKYCVSRQYGCFYLSNDGLKLYQSPNQEFMRVCKVFDLDNLNSNRDNQMFPIEAYHDLVLTQGISKFVNVLFDESFGISGRLLLYCKTKKSDYFMHQMYNQNELQCLFNQLSQNDYCLMPGMDNKPFNLVIEVFEMLYGTDLIETLIQSPMFNTALLKIQKSVSDPKQNVEVKEIIESNDNGSDMDLEQEQPGME